MKISYLGTTTLLFDDGTDQILFDCHVTRPSVKKCLFGKLSTDAEIADHVISEFDIDRLRGIFVSHSHHDHVLDVPYFAKRCYADVFGSPSALNVARGGGIAEEQLHSFCDSLYYQVGALGVTVIPSLHSAPHWFNNDIGKTIDQPLMQPAGMKAFREGGSHDFLVTHGNESVLIRPSCNYIEGQQNEIKADVLFLGITELSKKPEKWRERFFVETIGKVQPKVVIPIHWDNFFSPLYSGIKVIPKPFDYTVENLRVLSERCNDLGVRCIIQKPLTSLSVSADGGFDFTIHKVYSKNRATGLFKICDTNQR